MRLPDFVVVGAQRSGSSSLYRYLADHPGVFMSEPKELHFFDRRFDDGLEWYAQHFADAPPDALTGEATPAYLADATALERLAATLPMARTVAILREPAARAYSHFQMEAARGRERRPWREVLAAELAARVPGGYVERSRYGEQLETLRAAVGADRMYVLAFEDLRDRPRETYLALLDHLGLARVVPANVGKAVNRYFEIRSPALRKLSLRAPAKVRNILARANQVETEYEPLSAADASAIHEMLAADTMRAIDLARWSRNPWA